MILLPKQVQSEQISWVYAVISWARVYKWKGEEWNDNFIVIQVIFYCVLVTLALQKKY